MNHLRNGLYSLLLCCGIASVCSASDNYLGPPLSVGTASAGTSVVMNPYVASSRPSVAHGLGVIPAFVSSYLECLTAELGYSIGDRVTMADSSSSSVGWVVEFDAINIMLNTGTAPATYRKDTGAAVNITPANWKLVVTPFKVN